MEAAETETVHFVVTGEFLTTTARDLVLSDDPGRAYRILASSLQGEHVHEAVISLLAGTHDLVGDSSEGLELVEATDSESYKKTFRYIYGGRFRTRHGWCRPVAKIVCFGPADARDASTRVSSTGTAALKEWTEERAAYYCGEGETPHLLELDGRKAWVVFEPCRELPHWVRPPENLQAALDDALDAGRRLDERPSQIERQMEAMLIQEEAEAEAERKAEAEALEKEIEENERKYEEELQRIAAEVREQAGDDTFELELEDGRTFTVPRVPFVRWAFRTMSVPDFPDWNNVSPSGLKMRGDNPDHTDWVLGAGIPLEEAYADPVNEAAWEAAHRFQEEARESEEPYPQIRAAMEMLSNTVHSAAVVVDAGERTGTVGVDIAVFPDSEAERVAQLGDSVGVIVQKAGKMAHFAIVTRGRGITVMRHPDACDLFEEGDRVNLNPTTGRIVILDEDD